MTLRVCVVGAAGRMGSTVCRAVDDAEDLELVAVVAPSKAGRHLAEVTDLIDSDLIFESDLEAAVKAKADVVVDFTSAEVARSVFDFCLQHGLHVVSGTTGLSSTALSELTVSFSAPDGPNAIICPNFAISAVLMMRLAELAAPYFDGAEIIELHHDQKRDAPSGTAVETARRMAKRRIETDAGAFGADPTEKIVLEHARGASAEMNIAIHSVRLRGLVAHQEVIFGALGQSLTIRQDSYDRTSFMPGVLLAIANVARTPGLTIGLDQLLDR